MELRLTITVQYAPNGVREEALKDLLRAIVDRAFDEGGFTGETAAEVERWGYRVEKVWAPAPVEG